MRLITKGTTDMMLTTSIKAAEAIPAITKKFADLGMNRQQVMQTMQVLAAAMICQCVKDNSISDDEAFRLTDDFALGVRALMLESTSKGIVF